MNSLIDFPHLREFGWIRIDGAVPVELCERLVTVLQSELGVPVHDPSRWDDYGGEMRDLVPIWGHQAQWDIRQLPNLHHIWSELWGTQHLCVSLDSCRFTPPWKPGRAELTAVHWDHDPWNEDKRMFQGVIALTDTATNQGGFRCVPSLYRDRQSWPRKPIVDTDGEQNWLADATAREIVNVPAQTGDLIIWDSRLAHSNSKNESLEPRIAFYVMMGPGNEKLQQISIDSWRTGQCVPWWRNRHGYDRIEPWPPASLTQLGRRLLGLEQWS